MRILFGLTLTAFAAACGGSSTPTGDGGATTPFLGSYACTYSGTYTFTGSTVVNDDPSDMVTATISAGSGGDLSISGLVSGTVSGPCTTDLDVTSSTSATFSPTQQSCQFTDSKGSDQTNTRTGTLTLQGSSGATIALTGTFTGTTSAGAAYSGAFSGTWTCTKS